MPLCCGRTQKSRRQAKPHKGLTSFSSFRLLALVLHVPQDVASVQILRHQESIQSQSQHPSNTNTSPSLSIHALTRTTDQPPKDGPPPACLRACVRARLDWTACKASSSWPLFFYAAFCLLPPPPFSCPLPPPPRLPAQPQRPDCTRLRTTTRRLRARVGAEEEVNG